LQQFADVGQPCLVLTKSPHVLEDIPLLQRINQQSLAIVMTTLLTVDRFVSERIEAKAPLPALRLEMLSKLKRAGIPVGVAVVPIIPYVNDTDYVVRKVFNACAEREVDFVIWDYLYMPNKQHHIRIGEMLAHLGSYPNSYYRDIYGDQPLPDARYRAERNLEILRRCDQAGLKTPAPHKLYAGKLNPVNEVALLLKHTAFRNALQGQNRMADIHRELADLVYRGGATAEQLRASPLWKTIQPILGYDV
jgi:DNA repair photolyase